MVRRYEGLYAMFAKNPQVSPLLPLLFAAILSHEKTPRILAPILFRLLHYIQNQPNHSQ